MTLAPPGGKRMPQRSSITPATLHGVLESTMLKHLPEPHPYLSDVPNMIDSKGKNRRLTDKSRFKSWGLSFEKSLKCDAYNSTEEFCLDVLRKGGQDARQGMGEYSEGCRSEGASEEERAANKWTEG